MSVIFPGAVAQQVGGFYPRTGVDPNSFFSVVHITAGIGDALAIAKSVEAKKVTASFWINRDGKVYQTMLDPAKMGPWTNGFLNNPDLSNKRIARCVASGVNPNTRSLVTIENVGLEPGNPILPIQEAKAAEIIAYYHTMYGVPITRETVVGHYQFDSINRRNCPATSKAILDRIVELAQGDDMSRATLLKAQDEILGTFDLGAGHALINPLNTAQTFARPAGQLGLKVIGEGLLVTPDGQATDIDGRIGAAVVPARRTVYLVDDATFGGHALALQSDGTFHPAGITQADVDEAARLAAQEVSAAADAKAAEFE